MTYRDDSDWTGFLAILGFVALGAVALWLVAQVENEFFDSPPSTNPAEMNQWPPEDQGPFGPAGE